jgi:hypothetical protein
MPWESSSLTGEFVFRPAKAVVAAQAPARNAEQDAAATALREQMASLSAEIAKLREQRPAPSAAPAVKEEEFKQAQKEAAALRDQLAVMNAEIAKLRDSRSPPAAATPAQQVQDKKHTDEAESALRTQVASLNAEIAKIRLTTGPKEATPEEKAVWKQQLSKVEAQKGKLTLAGALITLLDISGADAAKIREFERQAGRREYSNAIAFGVDSSGLLSWGGSYRQMRAATASEVAVDFCERAGAKCRAVFVNGDFDEKAWFAAIAPLGLQPLEAVRTGLVSSVGAGITESQAGLGSNSSRQYTSPAMGYSFTRAAAR